MFNKNLLERLRILTAALVDAEAEGDEETVESLQEEIWELQDIIAEESEIEYADHHNKNWR